MSSTPRCTVITPTWQRRDSLFRTIASVQEQTLGDVEHLVISDGPDPELKEALAQPWSRDWHGVWYHELPVHDAYEHWGGPARLAGIELAAADYITYCDDDDVLRPAHCVLLAAALDAHPDAGFAVSQMLSHTPYGNTVIGAGELAAGNVGTPMIMHRRSVLEVASWGEPEAFEDWRMIWAWVQAGIGYVRVPEITSDVWPSVYR